jgi:hypothetical protein
MISWKPRPFIFIHIPRCAGTSIEQALLPMATAAAVVEELSTADRAKHWLPGARGRQHAKLARMETVGPLGEFFKFTIVRNPWARAVSQIEYLRAKQKKPPFTSDDFRENLRVYCEARGISHGHDLAAGQLDYLHDVSGAVAMDFIGRFESLSDDFKKICKKLGMAKPPVLPHIHSSRRARPYQDYYDKKTADWIRRRFARDIEYFGYQFD